MPRILKLDRMEIHGFKSFYGRTRFDFPEGITAVVGPNGCGKSNIGDAISWVLGEQKASSLRSDRMEDVIFNGSEGRRPLGMAEVSLHFINLLADGAARPEGNGNGNGNGHGNGHAASPEGNGHAAEAEPVVISTLQDDHEVPIPEAAESATPEIPPLRIHSIEEIPGEVVVTRRIYRSGESEYILNGERCRLKDVQDLLARTDIGSRLYSTIEQGKIDQVLTARPKDRRAMFEEAAGILGYRSKRRQAELKLEAAQANLLRINDIVVEVEKQINVLRRQAAKARRYQRLVDELRDKRLLLARQRLSASDQEVRACGDAIDALRAEEALAGAVLASDEAELERLRLLLEEGEMAARGRREEIHALDLEVDRIQERQRAGREQLADLDVRVAEGAKEIVALQERRSEQERQRAGVLGELAEVESLLKTAAASTSVVAADETERVRVLERLEAELEAARAALLEGMERISALTRRRAALEEQTRMARVALEKTTRESQEIETRRGRARDEVAALEKDAESGSERMWTTARDHEEAAAADRDARRLLAEGEKRAEELKGRAAILSERLAHLAEQERQRAGFSEGVGDILSGSAGVAARGVVGDRLRIPRGLEKAVEATLESLLEAVVVDRSDEAALGIAHLRGSARGRVSFVTDGTGAGTDTAGPADPPVEGSEVIGRLSDQVGEVPNGPIRGILERTLLVRDLDAALRLSASGPAFAYVTPEGDIVRVDGSVTGGDGRALSHWLLQRRVEREETERRATDLAAARQEAETSLTRLREEADGAAERLGRLAGMVQEETRVAFERDLRLQQARAEVERIERALPVLLSERNRLGSEIAACLEESTNLGRELESAETARRDIEASIPSRGADLAARRSELEQARRESAEARAALAAAEQRLRALSREKDSLEESLRDGAAMLERRTRERDEQMARAAQLRGLEQELETRRLAALQGRAEAAARDEAAHAGLAYERGLLHAREQAAKEGRAAQAAVRDRQQQHELRRARVEADLEHLERTCRDELATSIEALRGLPPLPDGTPAVGELETDVQKIRSDIDGVGPVNLTAVEQQGDLEERFAFLSAQKQDLDDAILSLRETIRTINREARERFHDAFTAIQKHFQECFKTLFNGGTAELRLAEGEDDVLEAGIEIVAQPPGKRLQKIGLLSGGEKALTAVALLVSLFRYRPSPFCVLDEVDAPLDEANVERFTRLLQQLRSDTQFILITHNRKSMEAADLLYGVTMEEPGVSKILPLRFE